MGPAARALDDAGRARACQVAKGGQILERNAGLQGLRHHGGVEAGHRRRLARSKATSRRGAQGDWRRHLGVGAEQARRGRHRRRSRAGRRGASKSAAWKDRGRAWSRHDLPELLKPLQEPRVQPNVSSAGSSTRESLPKKVSPAGSSTRKSLPRKVFSAKSSTRKSLPKWFREPSARKFRKTSAKSSAWKSKFGETAGSTSTHILD